MLKAFQNQKNELESVAKGLLHALVLNPHSGELYNNLGVTFHELNRDTDATRCYERALSLKPEYSVALNNLGVALVSLGQYEEAIRNYEKALAIEPDYAEALNNIGVAYHNLKQDAEAVARFKQALLIQPRYFDALSNLAHSLKSIGHFDEAAEKFSQALDIQPQNIKLRLFRADALARAQRTDEAITGYRDVIEMQPDCSDAHAGVAFLLQDVGQIQEAKANFEIAISINPKRPTYYRGWAFNSKVSAADVIFKKMQDLADTMPALNEQEAVQLHFALGKALADVGLQDEAFDHLLAGNKLKRDMVVYDEAQELGAIMDIPKIFTAEFLAEQRQNSTDSFRPIFIVGMPRSGSTLVEQILASHPNVVAGGELRALMGAVNDVAKCNFDIMIPEQDFWTSENISEISKRYIQALEQCLPARTEKTAFVRITDKRLGNFRLIGLIRIMFPSARIIHTYRDPIDTCLSCFSLLFEDTKFSYDLGELGRRYRAYQTVMAHWKRILPPGAVLHVKYEDVIEDIEFETRRLLSYCGLEWDPACLEFYMTNRTVRTASVVQVRQPIYKSSVSKWRPDAEVLRPLIDGFGEEMGLF